MTTKTVRAYRVRAGDSIPGLDNGYVFEAPEVDPSLGYGRYMTKLGLGTMVMIGYHTADGDEAYVVCPLTMPITVKTEGDDDRPEANEDEADPEAEEEEEEEEDDDDE